MISGTAWKINPSGCRCSVCLLRIPGSCALFAVIFRLHGSLMGFPAVGAVIRIVRKCARKGEKLPAFPAFPLDFPRGPGPLLFFFFLCKLPPAFLAVVGNVIPGRIVAESLSALLAVFFQPWGGSSPGLLYGGSRRCRFLFFMKEPLDYLNQFHIHSPVRSHFSHHYTLFEKKLSSFAIWVYNDA